MNFSSLITRQKVGLFVDDRVSKVRIIQDITQFPNQGKDWIEGKEGETYWVVNPIITNKEFVGSNCIVQGTGTIVPNWIYTGNGTAFRNEVGTRIGLDELNIVADTGVVVKVQGSNTGNVLERLNSESVLMRGKKIMEIDGAGALVLGTATISGNGNTDDSLVTVASSNILVFNMERVLATGVIANKGIIDFGTSLSTEVELQNIIYSGASTGHALIGLPNSGNINAGGAFECNGSNFLGSTNPLLNMGVNDIRHYFKDNLNLNDTQVAGTAYLSASATLTVGSGNIGTYLPVPSVNWTPRVSGKIQMVSNGGLKNISDRSFYFNGNIDAAAEKVGGGYIDIAIKLVRYNAATDDYTHFPDTVAQNFSNLKESLSGSFYSVLLYPNDVVYVYAANLTGSADILFTSLKIGMNI